MTSSMLDRVRRVTTAASPAPRVTAGKMRCDTAVISIAGLPVVRSVARPAETASLRPDAGSQPKRSANRKINITPSQKLGIEIPSKATTVPAVSVAEYLRMAEMTPTGMAMASDTAIAASVSSTVAGRRSQINRLTGSAEPRDTPRSPRASRPRNFTYCTWMP